LTTGIAETVGAIVRPRWVDGDRSILVEAVHDDPARTTDLWLVAADGTRPRRVAVATLGGDVRTGP
jgi:hypothetical protein